MIKTNDMEFSYLRETKMVSFNLPFTNFVLTSCYFCFLFCFVFCLPLSSPREPNNIEHKQGYSLRQLDATVVSGLQSKSQGDVIHSLASSCTRD